MAGDHRGLGYGDAVVIPAEQEISGDMTDEEIDGSWGLGPAEPELNELLQLDLGHVQGAARLGSLARVSGRQAANDTLDLLSKSDRENADGLKLIGRGAFGR